MGGMVEIIRGHRPVLKPLLLFACVRHTSQTAGGQIMPDPLYCARDNEAGELALDVKRETAGTVAVYRIVGRVDASTSPKLEWTVGSAIAGGTPADRL